MSFTNWNDLIIRYPGVSRAGGASDVSSAFLNFSDNEINGLLSEYFTVPFSSNNMTAVDLSLELSYSRIGVTKVEASDAIRKRVIERVARIKSGAESMMLLDGTVLKSTGEVVYSSDKDYNHTFGVGDVSEMFVDSSQLYDEDQDRN